jgi:SAM-dependent methyltransferase
VAYPSGYDAELRRHNALLRRAAAVRPSDHVLDIGCGGGLTTRQAAQAASEGSALGVDVSEAAVSSARSVALSQGVRNVSFEQADAQVHPFAPARFDLVISRFGTMFFGDPAAAFANIGRALRPGGRLAMAVWQARADNEWVGAVARALADAPLPDLPGPDPFSLADPAVVRELLGAAGFTDIAFADAHEPVYFGPDVPAALDWVRSFTCTSEILKGLAPADAERAIGRLRDELTAHLTEEGVAFDSRAWIVTARRGD